MNTRARGRASGRVAAGTLVAMLLHAGPAAAQRRPRHHRPHGRPAAGTPAEPEGTGGSTGTDTTSGEGEGTATPAATPAAGSTGDAHGTTASEAAPPPPPPVTPTGAPRPAALDIALGGRVFGRFLGYHDDLFNVMRAYELTAGPMLSAALEWYPGAHVSSGPAAWFGLTGSLDYAVAVSSERRSDHATFNTTAYRWTAGLRFRVPFGNGSDVGLGVGYAQQRYAIAPAMAATANTTGVPATDYGSVRVYASTRLALGDRVALLLGVGYLVVLSTGEMGSAAYFRRATVTTLEASVGLAVRIVGGFELRLGADMHRYGWAMNPEPGDPFIVGGAADQYYSVFALAAYRL